MAALLPVHSATYTDRFVWVFGWGLGRDADVEEVTRVLETAGRSGFNGAMFSFGLDTLCKRNDDYFRRLEAVKAACAKNHLEFIPAVFSVGYGGGFLSHDRHLAEGLWVENAAFQVKGGEARHEPAPVTLNNPGFEEFTGQRVRGFNFHDQPGEVSFVDSAVRHGGQASLRMENFRSNPHGHGRVMQEIRVQPRRCYRVSVWVKTENLQPASALRVQVLAGNRSLSPREFNLPATTDWRRLSLVFNSLTNTLVRLYVGVWGGRDGRFWTDDWSVEEIGPLNVLRRPGTPVTVRSDDLQVTYEEGRDYAPLTDPQFNFYQIDRTSPPLKLLPGSRIKEGQRLRVSWYHPMVIHESQVTVCMAEPALDDILDHEARLLAEKVRPRKIMLNMDEVRMGGTCAACRGKDMAKLLGECITRQTQTLRKHNPGAQVYVWSDMLDPHHNAHGDYYLVEGDFTGSWNHVPKDLVIAVWGGDPRPKSLEFFASQGFSTLIACYYDADNLQSTRGWLELAKKLRNVRGFMYTPWTKKYGLLPEFGALLQTPP
ncbi:hypothetical protein NXS98_09985 [Fontisphaera persica]|uniref:carbohydrate binding domain-containing protein n=1 Tax=Fontisphaera persica TaxID=2974023 RepID=UPI0024C00FEE|nr:carbohydrate binding domain-containing protein [Fontisphaera persica]WCJ58056.1 hypothetical protein NXS98_09985 [Fontisphaera persica]